MLSSSRRRARRAGTSAPSSSQNTLSLKPKLSQHFRSASHDCALGYGGSMVGGKNNRKQTR
eukprot:8526298-Pyramimonas_sp.AAC.1